MLFIICINKFIDFRFWHVVKNAFSEGIFSLCDSTIFIIDSFLFKWRVSSGLQSNAIHGHVFESICKTHTLYCITHNKGKLYCFIGWKWKCQLGWISKLYPWLSLSNHRITSTIINQNNNSNDYYPSYINNSF